MSLPAPHYVCKTCNHGFVKASILRDHENVHSGVKPYSCNQCGRAFANHGSRYQHERTHLNGKCRCACGRCFRRPQELKRHQRLGRAECSALGMNTALLSSEGDQMELIVSERAQLILSSTSTSDRELGSSTCKNLSVSQKPYYGNPQADLLLQDDAANDYMICAVRALTMMVSYRIRVAMGDATETSFKAYILDSLDVLRRMMDHLANSEGTLLFAMEFAYSVHAICWERFDSESEPDAVSLFRFARVCCQRLKNIPDDKGVRTMGDLPGCSLAVRDSLCNNYPELEHMANALKSSIENTMKTPAPAINRIHLRRCRRNLTVLREFVIFWNSCSEYTHVGISRSWDALIFVEWQIAELPLTDAGENLRARFSGGSQTEKIFVLYMPDRR